MLPFRLPLACASLIGLGLLSAADAWAGSLYKCDTGDGSIAYTSSKQGYANCKLISVFADAPKAAAASRPRPSPARAAPAKTGWVYEEGVSEPAKPDFAAVIAAVAMAPADIARVDFSAVSGGALAIELQDFSRVLADVTSDALMIGTPLFIAAPYRTPSPRPPATRNPPPRPQLASTAAATSRTPATRTLRGAVYRVERKGGITEYTNIKPRGVSSFAVLFTYIATCIACDVHSSIDFARTALNLDAYKDEIALAAAEYGVETSLLRAVIHAESAFNPMALSNKGAQGLMQLMPGTAGDLGVTDAFDASQNIRGGARYLAQLLKSFNGDTQLATAAYNAGPGAVQKYGGIPPYDETQVYVQRVATLRDRYAKAL